MNRRVDPCSASQSGHHPEAHATPALFVLSSFFAALAGMSALAEAQMTVVSRTGQLTVYCGSPGGPLIQHNFPTPGPTDDAVAVSDPGDATHPSSSATARLTAFASPGALSIVESGTAKRGALRPEGAYASADSRDIWSFTLSTPQRFRLTVRLALTSSEATNPALAFNFVTGGSGRIEPVNGPATTVLTGAITSGGTREFVYAGLLRAGQYTAELFGRSEGGGFPFTGSFETSFALVVGCLGDFNADGFITGEDFDGFADAFAAGTLDSDFDGDGFVTGDDFDAFVVAFESGC